MQCTCFICGASNHFNKCWIHNLSVNDLIQSQCSQRTSSGDGWSDELPSLNFKRFQLNSQKDGEWMVELEKEQSALWKEQQSQDPMNK